jgi:hypothetical protein
MIERCQLTVKGLRKGTVSGAQVGSCWFNFGARAGGWALSGYMVAGVRNHWRFWLRAIYPAKLIELII